MSVFPLTSVELGQLMPSENLTLSFLSEPVVILGKELQCYLT